MLTLEIGPMIAALAFAALFQAYMGWAFMGVAALVFTNVVLSIRDGAVLQWGGSVSEKKKERGWFWAWSAIHAYFGAFFLAGGLVMLLWP